MSRILLLIGFIFCSFSILSQSDQQASVREATLLKVDMKKPFKAVNQISRILYAAKKDDDYKTQGLCYSKLAKVYEDIQELDLALERRNKASLLFRKSESIDLLLNENYEIGKLNLRLGSPESAIKIFEDCLAAKSTEDFDLLCKEGIADAELMLGDTAQSLKAYKEIEILNSGKEAISNSNIRVNAKQSNIYSSQKKIELANEAFEKASQNFNSEATKEEVEIIDAAKNKLIDVDPDNEIPVRKQNASQLMLAEAGKLPAIKESIAISKKLMEKGKLSEAESELNKSLELVEPINSKSDIKEIYKTSSELSALKGNYQKALEHLNRYEALTREITMVQEKERDVLIATLKEQLQIDIAERDNIISFNERQLFESRTKNKNNLIFLLSLLLVGAILSSAFIYRNIQARRKANEMLLLKSMHAQVNPHFTYNALNSVNNFIAKNDERAANKYISDFSKLMRSILYHSQKDFITLEEELESIELYLKLEHARFEDKFDYEINVDPTLVLNEYVLPPMFLQPFIENAVWHGIRYLDKDGFISLNVDALNDKLNITVTDNGIGRKKSKAIKTNNQEKYKSTGIKNVNNRIALINRLYNKNYVVQIEDLHPNQENTGTTVSITLSV